MDEKQNADIVVPILIILEWIDSIATAEVEFTGLSAWK